MPFTKCKPPYNLQGKYWDLWEVIFHGDGAFRNTFVLKTTGLILSNLCISVKTIALNLVEKARNDYSLQTPMPNSMQMT